EECAGSDRRQSAPGKVPKLPNPVDRAVRLPNHPTGGFEAPPKRDQELGAIDIDVPFKVAKQKLVDEFDRRYLEALLEAHDNNISAAARAAGIERMSIYKMIRRLGLDKADVRNGNGNGPDDADNAEATDHPER